MKSLSVRDYPNTIAVMLRVFVEKACRLFLKRNKKSRLTVTRKKSKVDVHVAYATFGEILQFIASDDNKLIADGNIKRAIKKFRTGSGGGLFDLNTGVHNEEVTFHERDVRHAWENLEGLMQTILRQNQ
jgi:hypothetical protein